MNVGEGYLYRAQPTAATVELENKRSRWFSSGVPKGYSDLSGVCYPSGRALFIECKTPKGEPTEAQCIFLLRMLAAGANAGIAHSVDEALLICEMTEFYRQEMGDYINGWLEKIRGRGKRSLSRK
ncbi:MAG: VRR-NUC domain-containing protein [Porphyromonas sp.]|nr:VRR-NUC domain-containing protein [Porphyromonas sp.]